MEELELFLEDMNEQLSIMESALLDMSEIPLNQIDKEMINKVFRAMHTMKGNAGMFGYDTIVEFAHVAENLLDEIRNDHILLKQEMIDLFLLINDHSKVLIDVYTKDNELDTKQQKDHNYLLSELKNFLNAKDDNSEAVQEPLPVIESTIDDDSSQDKYLIKVKLKSDFFASGMDMMSIIKYLDAIGDVKDVTLFTDEIPALDAIEPLHAYLKLQIIYETDEPRSEIEDAFEFVQEDIELEISEYKEEKKEEEPLVVEEKTEVKVVDVQEKEIEKEDIAVKKETLKDESKNSCLSNEPESTNQEIEKPGNTKIPVLGNSFTLKVDSTKVDKLINQISEMVIANAKITQYAIGTSDGELNEAVEVMTEMLEEVRNGIMNIKMVQVGDSFSKLRRIVIDTAKKTGKEISFDIEGGETELDKTVIEKISDPLVHMLRNSVDHGIEIPSEREEKGKPSKGTIVLKAYPDAGSIVIEIIDDGKGIDKDIIYNKAVEKNIINPGEHLSDKEIYSLIFAPGFSTASQITNISGRGVGMDVVKKNIEDLRGSVEVNSKIDAGTTVRLRLPLTLAIIDGFLVQCGDAKYIIPLDNIQECIELKPEAKEQMNSKGYITLRSNLLPVLDILEYFEKEPVNKGRENIVVVKYGNTKVGLKVDELYGEFQTVIKPLGDLFENLQGISGGTILGNGEIALIFDIQKLIEDKISYEG